MKIRLKTSLTNLMEFKKDGNMHVIAFHTPQVRKSDLEFHGEQDITLHLMEMSVIDRGASVEATITTFLQGYDAVLVPVGPFTVGGQLILEAAKKRNLIAIGYAMSHYEKLHYLKENTMVVLSTWNDVREALKMLSGVHGSAGVEYAEAVATIQAWGI